MLDKILGVFGILVLLAMIPAKVGYYIGQGIGVILGILFLIWLARRLYTLKASDLMAGGVGFWIGFNLFGRNKKD